MNTNCSSALIHGYERMAAWADLLDWINVFPVADADTGRNLKLSLAPLRQLQAQPAAVPVQLMHAAKGNSGNIAAAFFFELLRIDKAQELHSAIQRGMRKAREAVTNPQPGTMLTVFDALVEALRTPSFDPSQWDIVHIIDRLQQSVVDSSQLLPVLRQAGVVDAGALGMFIFLEAFLSCIAGRGDPHRSVMEIFGGKLAVAADWQPPTADQGYCVNVTLTPHDRDAPVREWLAGAADSVVVTGPADQMNVHLHTTDRAALRVGLDTLGRVVNWSEARIVSTARRYDQGDQGVHIMTDAAGSLSLSDARQLGVTLLNSYLVVGEQSWPETLFDPERLYAVMVDGIKVSTAQASRYEKHESYLSAVSRFQRVLYLCVGSVYTGNYESAQRWKSENELGDRLSVIDTGAASGRLGLIVTATAEFAGQGADAQAVQCFAESTISQCRELVFLDQLKYLAAGGRVSKTKGFLGDLLRKKPIVSPTAHGAAKVGIVHNRDEQLAFALDRLDAQFPTDAAPRVLLQYADNRTWVQDIVAEQIHFRWPSANITVRPLSLTSGAHMGPGTWAMAYL